jgi:hypothetical protein
LLASIDKIDVLSQHIKLFDIESNPFTGSDVRVRYFLEFDGFTRLELFTSKGELARVLVNGEVLRGTYDLVLSTAGLSSGVYMLRLTSGQFTETKQLVIMK